MPIMITGPVRLYDVCVLAALGCLYSLVSGYTDEYGPTEVRQWSDWYNTDHPRWGNGDDESVTRIRQRGFTVCDGSAPVDAVCRIADQQDVVFNEETTGFTHDQLAVPCTPDGIVCRNYDQSPLILNLTCLDYEIRFECLTDANETKKIPNMNVIGVAAAISVVIPILCVVIMHLIRVVKEKRRGRESSAESQDQQSQTDYSSLPPSYDQLFGTAYGSTENLLGSRLSLDSLPISAINSTRMQTSESSSGVDSSSGGSDSISLQTRTGLIYSISEGLSDLNNDTTLHAENELQSPRRLRFPGMHLSICDLMTAQDGGSSSPQCSPQLSPASIRTPPPSYGDALVILGGIPSKADPDK